jgi:hypothetical protein
MKKAVLFLTVVLWACSLPKTDERGPLTGAISSGLISFCATPPAQFASGCALVLKSEVAKQLDNTETYSLFLPSNTSINAWLTITGKSALADVTATEALTMMRKHVAKPWFDPSAASLPNPLERLDGKTISLTRNGGLLLNQSITVAVDSKRNLNSLTIFEISAVLE